MFGMTGESLVGKLSVLMLICASATLGALIASWNVCFGGLSAECAAASSEDSSWVLPSTLWLVSIAIAIVGLFLAPRRPLALIAVGILVVINPLTDHGAFFLPWDTADTIPFTGMWIAVAASIGALLLLLSSQPSATQRISPSVHNATTLRSISARVR